MRGILSIGSRVIAGIAFASIILASGCSLLTGPKADSTPDAKTPFDPWGVGTIFVHRGTYSAAAGAQDLKAGRVRTQDTTLGGVTYDLYKAALGMQSGQLLDTTTANATTIWANRLPDGSMKIAGGKDRGFLASILPPIVPGVNGSTLILDSSFTIQTKPPLNTQQSSTVTGKLYDAANPATPKNFKVDMKYTRDQDNAIATTSMGPVEGCSHFTVSATPKGDLAILTSLLNIVYNGEAWYHDKLGLVAYKCPALGLDANMNGESDYGTATEGANTIRKVQVLDANHPVFELNTYDRARKNDADKMSHAQMLLEFRWASDSLAKNGTAPNYLAAITLIATNNTLGYSFVDNRFGWGAVLVSSPVSIFHPEENGKGYKYWYVYVNEAAKNEPGANNVSYLIRVSQGSFVPPALRCSARIMYTILPAGSY
jgi:hypothetical protein